MIYNVILYIACGFIFESWVLPLYSIIAYYAALKTLDFIVEGISRSKAAFIVTLKPSEVGKALSDNFGLRDHRNTRQEAATPGTDRTVLYFVVNRFQIGKMRSIVHDVDPTAYITINDVAVFSAQTTTRIKQKSTAAAEK